MDIMDNIRGLKKFKEYFEASHEECIIIGRTACFIHLANNDLNMRITKDYDIILSLGALTKPFILKLREFIIKAGYNTIACGSSSKNLFRFSGPRNDDFS